MRVSSEQAGSNFHTISALLGFDIDHFMNGTWLLLAFLFCNQIKKEEHSFLLSMLCERLISHISLYTTDYTTTVGA